MTKKQSLKNGAISAPIALGVVNAKANRSTESDTLESSAKSNVPNCFTLKGAASAKRPAATSRRKVSKPSARKNKINYTSRKPTSPPPSPGSRKRRKDDAAKATSFNFNPTLMLAESVMEELRKQKRLKKASGGGGGGGGDDDDDGPKTEDEFYGRAKVADFEAQTSHDLQQLMRNLQALHEQFAAQSKRLTAIMEPSLDQSLNFFRNMKNAFAWFFSQVESEVDVGDQAKLFDDAINFVNNRCKEVKVLKKTNDAKADEVERLLQYVEKMQYAVSTTHDIRRLPSAVRPLVRPTFDYVPGSDNQVACVVKKAPLPRTISTVQIEPPKPKNEGNGESDDLNMDALLDEAMQEFEAEEQQTPPVTLVTQLGTDQRDQSMAPSQRANVLSQSMIHRFTHPLDSSAAHAGKRAGAFCGAEKLRRAYVLAAQNRAVAEANEMPEAQKIATSAYAN